MARTKSEPPIADGQPFDLNIQRVLEHWTVAHAVREVIANALDEQVLSDTAEVQLEKDLAGDWHIRDFGRGLRHEHLAQNESKEKLQHTALIGKFGVGLKDALATFDRHNIRVVIRSRHADVTTAKMPKHGFALSTLHALVAPPSDRGMVGTDFVLSGLRDNDMDMAKQFFLRYSGDEVLEKTTVGEVLTKADRKSRIYVNGLLVAEEEQFLFSYNITAPTKALRQALNRERTNVGRAAYSPRVKAILLACSSAAVANPLANDLERMQSGKANDEVQWIEVAVQACRILNATERVIFLTAWDLSLAPRFVADARADGYRVVIVPETVARKLPTLKDLSGNAIRDLLEYRREWESSFEFEFVDEAAMTDAERAIWARTAEILRLVGGKPRAVKDIRVSETMRLSGSTFAEAVGLWEPLVGRIVIKRNQLANLASYAATLVHEVIHARSGAEDLDPAFEEALTTTLGRLAERQMSAPKQTRSK